MGGAGLDLPSRRARHHHRHDRRRRPSSASLTTLVASVAPAIKASRVAPLAALRDVAVDRSGASKVRAVLGLRDRRRRGARRRHRQRRRRTAPWAGPGSAPSPCWSASSSSGPSSPARRPAVLGVGAGATRGFTGRLARRNAMRNPRRIAGSAAALMVGTAVVALFTTFGSSVKASIDDMVDENFGGDLVVAQTDFSGAGIDPAMAPAIAELPEVADAVGSATRHGADRRRHRRADGDRSGRPRRRPRPRRPPGRLADVGPGEIAVSTRYAEDHDARTRRRRAADVRRRRDDATCTVAAIFERQDVMGNLIMTSDGLGAARRPAMDVVLFVTLADGVTEAAGQAAVAAVTERLRRTRPADPGRVRRLDRRAGRPDAVRRSTGCSASPSSSP